MNIKSDNRRDNKTRKVERGGDIHNRSVFKHILSIGYELETSSLSKWTLMNETALDGNPILLNTDTARKDLEMLQNISEDEYDEDNPFHLRREEELHFDAYDRNNKVDKNVSFLVTNDIVNSPFIQFLNKKCIGVEKEKEEEILNSEAYVKIEEKEEAEEYLALEVKEFKNTIYSFEDKNGKKYNMRFVFHDKVVPCGLFSDVEWIFTYYKPKQSGNIILDTFANTIHNLLLHVRDLKPIQGTIHINTCLSKKGGNSQMKSKEQKTCDIIANNPQERILFHKPGTNLHYLQSHHYEDSKGTTLGIEDICITPQMTFSAHISNIIPIMKNMINDTIRSIPTTTEILVSRLETLNKIEYIVNLLIGSYNESVTGSGSSKFVFLNNTAAKKDEMKVIKSYLFLIFYKLFLFYQNYHNNTSTNIQYFKNSLFFNSRHSNYILYDALKKSIRRYFGENENAPEEHEIPMILQKLCVQSEILEKYLVSDIKSLRKNIFRRTNIFDKKNISYGNPAKSLISYFQFFEDPIKNDENVDEDGTILYHDYLEYKRIDAYSAKMDLKSDIVLVELRVFTRLVSSYIYSILGDAKKKKMTNGICNRMTNNFQPDVKGLSLDVLSDFYDHYHEKNPISISKKKKSKTRSKPKHLVNIIPLKN